MQRRTTLGTTPVGTTTARHLTRRGGALVTAGLTLTALGAGAAVTGPASAATTSATTVSLFPTDALTVADAGQLTGKRVNLPTDVCSVPTAPPPYCGLVTRLNELDGFDLDPRLALHFDAPVTAADVIASVTVKGMKNTFTVDRVVVDNATNTVYAHPVHQLNPSTTYTLSVSAARGLPAASTTFTTMSATDGLLDLRKQLDDGSAYTAAGIAAADRGLKVDAVVPTIGTSFTYNADTGGGKITPTPVPALAPGIAVFGSYLAPSWLRPDVTIAQTPTADAGPTAAAAVRLPFLAVIPSGKVPAGGFPTTLFGHGFTRSEADVLLAASTNAGEGIATIATDVVGHGFGAASTWSFTRGGTTTTVPAYARGTDQNGDGTITSFEGSSTLPNGATAAVSNRDGLRQTAADDMTLLRAVARGLSISGTPATELRTTGIDYEGQSFGGIYGAMLAGADPKVDRSVLNVAGGPVTEVAGLAPSAPSCSSRSPSSACSTARTRRATTSRRPSPARRRPRRGPGPRRAEDPGLPGPDHLARPLRRPDGVRAPDRPGPDPAAERLRRPDGPQPDHLHAAQRGGLFGRDSLYRNDRTRPRRSTRTASCSTRCSSRRRSSRARRRS